VPLRKGNDNIFFKLPAEIINSIWGRRLFCWGEGHILKYGISNYGIGSGSRN